VKSVINMVKVSSLELDGPLPCSYFLVPVLIECHSVK